MTAAISIGAVVLLLLAFWIRAAGTAVTRVPRADALRDSSEGVNGARAVADLLEEREVIGPAVGVVASALMIFSVVLATALFVETETGNPTVLLISISAGFVVILIGDLVPRAVGRLRPREFAYRSSSILKLAVALGGWANDLILEVDEEPDAETEALHEADEHERDLIDSVLEFGETIVREVMTPRPDMITVPVTATVEELVDVASDGGFSRVPVTSDGDVVGTVIVKDLLPMLTDRNRPSTVADVMRTVKFVPETKHAASLLSEMQESHTHQVIVVDEYGDVAGLVTIEDLLEELVGEIADETDLEEDLISETDDGWHVDARLPVDDLADTTGIDVPDEDWDTVGGLVLGLAERIPEVGEEFTYGQLVIQVSRMQGRRVSAVEVSIGDAPETE